VWLNVKEDVVVDDDDGWMRFWKGEEMKGVWSVYELYTHSFFDIMRERFFLYFSQKGECFYNNEPRLAVSGGRVPS
jgi:hypothetical protein